jgi:hypothetical protein
MAAFLRWKFEDPADPNPLTNTYTLLHNPSKQTSPFPARDLAYQGTTAVDGQVLVWEGMTNPVDWSFSGTVFNAEHYEALRTWVYDRKGRMFVWDHFGRRLTVVFKKLSAEPPEAPKPGMYWFHTYTVEALVLAITAPASGLPE